MSRIKLCGLSRNEDIEAVNLFLPDYIGLVFASSKRQVSIARAAALRQRLDPRIRAVGVFVGSSLREIGYLTEAGIIDIVQLHGDESEEMVRQVRQETGKPVIKAVSVREPGDILRWQDSDADYLLFDQGRGGTGTAFNWNYLETAGAVNKPFFLAGGLNPDNLEQALAYRPYGVDISSGAESEGRKDREKIEKLTNIVRRQKLEERRK